jgi:outer membrane lipoprotein-sorting protein
MVATIRSTLTSGMAVALAWLLAACAALPGGPVAGLPPEPVQVTQGLEARRQWVRTFKAQGEIQGVNAQGQLSGEHSIMGRFPDRLRAEIRGPMGRLALLLVSDGVKLTVIAPGENKAYQGPATRRNLSRFLGLALSPTEVYALVSGSVPLLPQSQAKVFLSSEPGKAVLQLDEKGGNEEGLIFGLGDYAVYEAWLRGDRIGLALKAKFESFQNLEGQRFPRRILLTDGDGRSLTLDNDTLVLNLPLDDAIFEVTPSPRAELQILD